MMNNSETAEYFEKKAEGYDLVENQPYWRLSDALLWSLLASKVFNRLPANFSFLDAGGGTGRWTKKVLENYPESTGHLKDISGPMLAVARRKFERMSPSRITISRGDIQRMSDLEDESFDLVFSFHNVIGFVENAVIALKEQLRVLKKGGILVTVAPSRLHMVFFNIFTGNLGFAEQSLESNRGRFVSGMPEIDNFTPEQLTDIYAGMGVTDVHVHGFPVLIYPGYQETQLHGSTHSIENLLSESENFDKIFRMESRVIKNESVASRGNNLFIFGTK